MKAWEHRTIAMNFMYNSKHKFLKKQWDVYHQGIRDAVVNGAKDLNIVYGICSYNEGWKFGIQLCDEKEEIDRQVNR
jgi:hypothetical protein